MKEDRHEVDHVAYGHSLKFLGALFAFSVGAILLVIQGSIPISKGASLSGAVSLIMTIPFCFCAFVLNVKLLRYGDVSAKSMKLVDRFIGLAAGLGICGFGLLLIGVSRPLGYLLVASIVAAFLITWFTVYRFEKHEKRDTAEE